MYTLLILFFISLAGIVFMIGRKLRMIQNGDVLVVEEFLLDVPHLEKVKDAAAKSLRRYGHMTLVAIITIYVRGTILLKKQYAEIKNSIRRRQIDGEKKEISKFLKVIGDYKHKVREIKHKIHKEESL